MEIGDRFCVMFGGELTLNWKVVDIEYHKKLEKPVREMFGDKKAILLENIDPTFYRTWFRLPEMFSGISEDRRAIPYNKVLNILIGE